jgi:hypothetical protein
MQMLTTENGSLLLGDTESRYWSSTRYSQSHLVLQLSQDRNNSGRFIAPAED